MTKIPEKNRQFCDFRSLGKAQIKNIIDLQLVALQKRLGERKITININDDVKGLLTDKGYGPACGPKPFI